MIGEDSIFKDCVVIKAILLGWFLEKLKGFHLVSSGMTGVFNSNPSYSYTNVEQGSYHEIYRLSNKMNGKTFC